MRLYYLVTLPRTFNRRLSLQTQLMNSNVVCPAERLAQVCQVLAGRTLDWSDPPDPIILRDAFAPVPLSTTELEALGMERLLMCFAARLEAAVHRNFHTRFNSTNCECAGVLLQPVRDHRGHLRADESVGRWATAFHAQFLMRHNSPAQRARRLLDASHGKDWTVDALARAVGTGRRTLERQFLEETRMSIARYGKRLRLVAAARQIRNGEGTMEGIALDTGWGSKKGMYDAFAELTTITPFKIQDIGDKVFDDLLARLTDAPAA